MKDQAINILLIEDDEEDYKITRNIVAGFTDVSLHRVATVAEASQYLKVKRNQDVILLDLFLPDSEGLATYEAIQHAAGSIPVVVIARLTEAPAAIEACLHGAKIYLLKEIITGELVLKSIQCAIQHRDAHPWGAH